MPYHVIIIIVSAILFLTGCKPKADDGNKENPETAAPTPVAVSPVTVGDITLYLTLSAVVEPARSVDVFARTIGRIETLAAEEGDRVVSGQMLARLDNQAQSLALERAQAALERQRSIALRKVELHRRNMLPSEEREQAELALNDAELTLKQAQLELEYTRITAPFAGIVSARHVDGGDRVDVARPLFTLVDDSRLYAHSWVTVDEARVLKPGMTASIYATNASDHPARVARISPVVEPEFGKVKVTFEIESTPAAVKPGQFVEIKLPLESYAGVALLPKSAVVYEAGSPVVYVFRDSLALRRLVGIGLTDAENVQILDGITIDDSVIVEGHTTIRDSAKVKIVEQSARAAGATG